jgi:hypothetical protein
VLHRVSVKDRRDAYTLSVSAVLVRAHGDSRRHMHNVIWLSRVEVPARFRDGPAAPGDPDQFA